MKEYIERGKVLAEIDKAFNLFVAHEDILRLYSDARSSAIYAPAADVVSRAAFDQVMWERDVAIQQLREDYGVGLGEKKAADVVERKRGEWILTKVEYGWNCAEYPAEYTCSVCGRTEPLKEPFCNCGADMREVDHESH